MASRLDEFLKLRLVINKVWLCEKKAADSSNQSDQRGIGNCDTALSAPWLAIDRAPGWFAPSLWTSQPLGELTRARDNLLDLDNKKTDTRRLGDDQVACEGPPRWCVQSFVSPCQWKLEKISKWWKGGKGQNLLAFSVLIMHSELAFGGLVRCQKERVPSRGLWKGLRKYLLPSQLAQGGAQHQSIPRGSYLPWR